MWLYDEMKHAMMHLIEMIDTQDFVYEQSRVISIALVFFHAPVMKNIRQNLEVYLKANDHIEVPNLHIQCLAIVKAGNINP